MLSRLTFGMMSGALVLLILAAGALYQFIGLRRAGRIHVPPGTMLDVHGQRLHVLCAGNGTPAVLFESGIAASSLSWTRVLREVATFTRACAYDRAGLGWSDPARGSRSVARMLGELRGVLTHATAATGAPCILVGHSFGAFLAYAYASTHPADIAGLVLLDPPSEWHEITRRQARMLWGGIQLSRIGGILARIGVVRGCLALLSDGAPGLPRSFVRIFGPTTARTLERLVGEVRKLPPEVHPIVQALWCQPKCFRAMADHLGALEETAAVVAGVTSLPDVPMVVVSSGDQSPDTIARHRALAGLSSHGRHVIAAKAGHWIQFDDPDFVITTIRDVVDRARRRNAAQRADLRE
jgi:pimeloyl-ACP methyl ester carboxylesterase